ncbi:MAG: putative lipid II flippase FtsW [Gammaproteobacteria bacterium]|nr:putative lipid II flippase FtsW [Gammaproteobacteria bacterium]
MLTKPVQLNIGFNKFGERRSAERLSVDPVIFLCSLALLVIGLVMMTSASITAADNTFGDPFYYSQRQLFFIAIGLSCGYLIWRLPLKTWDTLRPMLLVLGILLLVIVLIPGVGQVVNGSARWIRMGSFNVQVSEIVKILMIVFLAGYLSKHRESLMQSSRAVILPMVILSVVATLLLFEPDLGATVVIFATGLSMLLLAGVRVKVFLFLLAVAAAGFFLLAYTSPYRLVRLTAFINPWDDPFNSGFQLSQSLIAFGRGEWFGVGLGESVQKLFYLPEAHTDFLFAVIAEELGVMGALTIIVLYTGIAWRALFIGRAAQKCDQHFAAFIAYGVGCWLVFQAYVNIGVNMGVLPTKGLTLPLMSYGGSSIVMSLIAIALLMRADYELRFQYSEVAKERRATC